MTVPISEIAIITSAGLVVFKEPINKLLGPVSEHYGNELLEFAKNPANSWLVTNVSKVLQAAIKKLGARINSPGSVPPRIVKTVINESMWSDDAISTEYFGGVLASSRTESGRDDRGVRIAKTISRMSVYQLRTHYIVYSTVANLFAEKSLSLTIPEQTRRMRIFIPLANYVEVMDFSEEEWDKINSIISHTFNGLVDDGLIGRQYAHGSSEQLKSHIPLMIAIPSTRGIVCNPTSTGAELFLWAFGHGNQKSNFLFDEEFISQIGQIPNLTSVCVSVNP